MMKTLLYRLLFILSILVSITVHAEVVRDSSSVEVRLPDEEKIQDYLNNEDFVYDREPLNESHWDSFINWLMNYFADLMDNKAFSVIWEILKWLLIAGALAYVVIKLLNIKVSGLFYAKKASNVIDFISEDEDINELDFDKMIATAVQNKNFKEAVRLSYLRVLKLLVDADLIDWQIDKTNTDYYNELKKTNFRKDFLEVSKFFEYIWYGEFEIDEEGYSKGVKLFDDFRRKINR